MALNLGDVAIQFKVGTAPLKKARKEITKFEKRVKDLTASLDKLHQTAQRPVQVRLDLRGVLAGAAAFKLFNDQAQASVAFINNLNSSFTRFSQNFARVAGAFSRISLNLKFNIDLKPLFEAEKAIRRVTKVIEELNKVSADFSKVSDGFVKMANAFRKASEDINRSAEAFRKTSASASQASEGFQKAASSANNSASAFRNASGAANRAGARVKTYGKKAKVAAEETSKFSAFLDQAATSAQLSLGPLSGVASRLITLKKLVSTNTLALASFSASLGLFITFLIKSVKPFSEIETELNKIENALMATGRAATTSLGEVKEIADKLAIDTLASVREARAGLAQALTFTNIPTDQLERFLRIAKDTAFALDRDLKGTVTSLAKAIQAPASALDGLGRAGIFFSKSQREMLQALADTGQEAEVTEIILAKLEERFKGIADARGVSGALDTLAERATLFKEAIFENGPAAREFAKLLGTLAKAFEEAAEKGNFATRISNALGEAFSTLNKAITFLIDNSETIITILKTLTNFLILKTITSVGKLALGIKGFGIGADGAFSKAVKAGKDYNRVQKGIGFQAVMNGKKFGNLILGLKVLQGTLGGVGVAMRVAFLSNPVGALFLALSALETKYGVVSTAVELFGEAALGVYKALKKFTGLNIDALDEYLKKLEEAKRAGFLFASGKVQRSPSLDQFGLLGKFEKNKSLIKGIRKTKDEIRALKNELPLLQKRLQAALNPTTKNPLIEAQNLLFAKAALEEAENKIKTLEGAVAGSTKIMEDSFQEAFNISTGTFLKEMDDVEKSLKKITAETDPVRRRFNKVQESLSKLKTGLGVLQAKDALGMSVEDQEKLITATEKKIALAEKERKELARIIAISNKTGLAAKKVKDILEELENPIRKAGVEASKFESKMAKIVARRQELLDQLTVAQADVTGTVGASDFIQGQLTDLRVQEDLLLDQKSIADKLGVSYTEVAQKVKKWDESLKDVDRTMTPLGRKLKPFLDKIDELQFKLDALKADPISAANLLKIDPSEVEAEAQKLLARMAQIRIEMARIRDEHVKKDIIGFEKSVRDAIDSLGGDVSNKLASKLLGDDTTSFHDIAKSFVQKLFSALIQQVLIDPIVNDFKSILSAAMDTDVGQSLGKPNKASFAKKFISGIASFFSPATAATGAATGAAAGVEVLPAGGMFANGGFPPLNRPSLVGEKGPELFIPKQRGLVVPNNQMGMMGGQNVTVNMTVNTPDAESFQVARARISDSISRGIRTS